MSSPTSLSTSSDWTNENWSHKKGPDAAPGESRSCTLNPESTSAWIWSILSAKNLASCSHLSSKLSPSFEPLVWMGLLMTHDLHKTCWRNDSREKLLFCSLHRHCIWPVIGLPQTSVSTSLSLDAFLYVSLNRVPWRTKAISILTFRISIKDCKQVFFCTKNRLEV